MFQGSLKYAPLLKMKPNPKIFNTISIVYNAKKTYSTKSCVGVVETASGSSIPKVIEFAKITPIVNDSKALLRMMLKAASLM